MRRNERNDEIQMPDDLTEAFRDNLRLRRSGMRSRRRTDVDT